MKRILLLSTAALFLILTAVVLVRAEVRSGHGWYGRRWHHPGPASDLVHQLKLNDAQREQIRSLWQAERADPFRSDSRTPR